MSLVPTTRTDGLGDAVCVVDATGLAGESSLRTMLPEKRRAEEERSQLLREMVCGESDDGIIGTRNEAYEGYGPRYPLKRASAKG